MHLVRETEVQKYMFTYYIEGQFNFMFIFSLRSRRYSRAQGEKLEIPPAQKLSILSSAHRAHGSAHTNCLL